MLESVVRKFLYHPIVLGRNDSLPAYANDAREVRFSSTAGDEIHALYWEAPRNRPTLLYLHGNAQSVFEWALVRDELQPMDCGLLLIDYPGYGKSSGSPSEQSLYASGAAALEWLKSEEGIAEENVVLLGKSLGGGVACEIAMDRKLKGVILESTFRSIPAVIHNLIPILPGDTLLKTERYDSISKLPRIVSPVLVVHGTKDELIPVEEGQALFEAVRSSRDIYLVEGAGHNDVSLFAGIEYGKRLRRWLNSLEAPATP